MAADFSVAGEVGVADAADETVEEEENCEREPVEIERQSEGSLNVAAVELRVLQVVSHVQVSGEQQKRQHLRDSRLRQSQTAGKGGIDGLAH